MTARNSRAGEDAVNVEVGEELHHCGYCGTRTVLSEAPGAAPIETGTYAHHCPHCAQHFILSDAEDD